MRPQQIASGGIAFHPLSASLAAAATRPGLYFAAQPGAAVPRLATSAGVIPATSLASGTVVGTAGAREPGMIFHDMTLSFLLL